MHDAFTRSTLGYATVLFAVLFAPQFGLTHHDARATFRVPAVFPDRAFTWTVVAVSALAVAGLGTAAAIAIAYLSQRSAARSGRPA